MKADLFSAGIAIGSLFILWAIWRLWERHYEKKKHVQEELERLHRYRTEIQLYDRWAEVRTEAMRWREAIINELVIAHIYSKEHDDNPRKAIQDAISWNCAVALDPAVSSDAQALVEKGRAGMEKDAMRPLYVAVDIGCLECGESSDVLGIFTSEQDALNVLDEAEQKQAADWHGEHSFQVFKIAAIVSASAVEGKTSTEVRALTPLLETKE